jgi:hypothetical protein
MATVRGGSVKTKAVWEATDLRLNEDGESGPEQGTRHQPCLVLGDSWPVFPKAV